jgi:tetratricopeptide (TPR) repeat protein
LARPPLSTPRQAALIQQGISFHNRKQFPEAERCYQTVLRENPGHPDALNLMGVLAVEANRMPLAVEYFRKAVGFLPKEPMYLNNLGNALILTGSHDEAARHLQRALKANPNFADAWANLGKCFRQAGATEDARRCYEKALAIQPGFTRARAGLAEAAAELGRFEEAEKAFAEILRKEPSNVEALCGMAMVRSYPPGDPLAARIRDALVRQGLSEDDRTSLHHALAKILNDAGDHDGAMEEFARGKACRSQRFDLAHHKAAYDALTRSFSPDFFRARQGFGSPDERPVFIVGMPRSGTTLTEQVLASHPQAEGLGELRDMRMIAAGLGFGSADPLAFSRRVEALTADDCSALARRYQEAYARAPATALRLIDKSPHNFELLGLITLLFPKARIIHCRRDPMDTCVAAYMQNFSLSHAYNLDLATLGTYYRHYEGLMQHWSQCLPLALLDHPYEAMVQDFEAAARRLVAHAGLPWDEACLNYAGQERQVRTPSRWQVRQPIYASSIGRWKRYERHLGPLQRALGLG